MRALLGLQLLEEASASASASASALGPPLYHQQTTSRFQTGVNSISPSVVVIIIILAVIFFLSGCLHLLIRYIARTPTREAGLSSDTVGILQGQLQQLFHLHDSGVDQAFIDTLPVFLYKSVKGLKEATDCAVCLCTFDGDDALRLLPKCSHAFHTDCIDTWLLSHSTCPLCRASLLPESNTANSSDRLPNINILPMAYVADHSEDEHRQQRHYHQPNAGDLEVGNQQQQPPVNACISSRGNISSETPKSDECLEGEDRDTVGKLMPIKLGKFTNTEARHGGLSCSNNMDPKRSYSMGSYEYVLDPSSLHVFITPTVYKKQTSTKTVPLTPGHRPNLSECILPEDIERSVQLQLSPNEEIVCQSKIIKALHYIKKPIKREESGGSSSFKVAESGSERWGSASSSKTWMRSSSEYAGGSSRRSCRFHNAVDATNNLGSSRRSVSVSFGDHQNNHHHQIAKPWVSSGRVSEMASCRSSSGEAEVEEAGPHPKTWEFEVEIVSQSNETSGSSASNDDGSESSGTSFARRTINWLVGRPKRIVHAASSSQPTMIET